VKNFLICSKSLLASKLVPGSKDIFVWFFRYLIFGWTVGKLVGWLVGWLVG
jgi:hypothetical protein